MYAKIGMTIVRRFARSHNVNELRCCYATDVFECRHYSGGDVYALRNTTSSSAPYLPNNIKILFIVTIVFIVTYFCYAGMRLVNQITLTASQFPLYAFIVSIYFIHNFINPFLYAKMDSVFLKRCKRLLNLSDN